MASYLEGSGDALSALGAAILGLRLAGQGGVIDLHPFIQQFRGRWEGK